MRALVFDNGLKYEPSYADPQVTPGECLVNVHLAGICSTDLQIVRGYMGYVGVLGHEMVGTVQAGSEEWLGKRVVCEINCVCRKCDMCQAGLANHCRNRTVMGIAGRDGCFADQVLVPERNLIEVPSAVADEQAVFIEPLAAAWQVVTQIPVDSKTRVLVLGSGRLGLLVAQVVNQLGCNLEVVGRNHKSLGLCERKHIQSRHVDEFIPRADRDLVVECTGSPAGLELALCAVRPRGTIALKSTYAGRGEIDLAPAVVNEVAIIGSRCGPFSKAIGSLLRREVDVQSMISRTFKIERAVEAIQAAADRNNIKVLLKINPS